MFYDTTRSDDLQVAFNEGYEAYRLEQNGDLYGRMTTASNPYTGVDDDARYDAWDEGYSAAAWDN